MIKSLLILAVFTYFSAHALTVVSDLDDTIKITNVKELDAVVNALKKSVFLGMPQLLHSLRHSAKPGPLFVVSGSPEFLRPRVERLMEENKIQIDGIFLANGSGNKGEILDELVSKIQDDIILMGDDQEKDPILYENLKRQFPDKVKAIYIHQVNESTLPVGQKGFLTAYEIALYEQAAGRLTVAQAHQIKASMDYALSLNLLNPFSDLSEKLIPEWQECSSRSIDRVLAPVRTAPSADLKFLNRIKRIALKNCDD